MILLGCVVLVRILRLCIKDCAIVLVLISFLIIQGLVGSVQLGVKLVIRINVIRVIVDFTIMMGIVLVRVMGILSRILFVRIVLMDAESVISQAHASNVKMDIYSMITNVSAVAQKEHSKIMVNARNATQIVKYVQAFPNVLNVAALLSYSKENVYKPAQAHTTCIIILVKNVKAIANHVIQTFA